MWVCYKCKSRLQHNQFAINNGRSIPKAEFRLFALWNVPTVNVHLTWSYNRVKKANFTHNLFLVYFVNLYMFLAYLGPSSGGTTVFIQQLVKVKWSRYRSSVAQKVGRGIALLFHDRGTRRGWVVSNTPRPQFPPGTEPVPILQEAG